MEFMFVDDDDPVLVKRSENMVVTSIHCGCKTPSAPPTQWSQGMKKWWRNDRLQCKQCIINITNNKLPSPTWTAISTNQSSVLSHVILSWPTRDKQEQHELLWEEQEDDLFAAGDDWATTIQNNAEDMNTHDLDNGVNSATASEDKHWITTGRFLLRSPAKLTLF